MSTYVRGSVCVFHTVAFLFIYLLAIFFCRKQIYRPVKLKIIVQKNHEFRVRTVLHQGHESRLRRYPVTTSEVARDSS